jgi:D-glycero-D-manno-heptose 1,7-bisphosphate phosphatase
VIARRALFLDRDGTLIADVGYPRDPDQVALLPGAAAALRSLAEELALVIISNQSGIARGIIHPDQARAVHERTVARFADDGVTFAGAYYCPHGPDDGCACRKPQPGMLAAAARDLDLDLAASIVIGDKASDVEVGRAAGCRAALRFAAADAPADDLAHADVIGWDAATARIAALLRSTGLE